MHKILCTLFLCSVVTIHAQDSLDESSEMMEDTVYQATIDSIENSYHYQTGIVHIGDGIATLTIPEDFKYLDPEQSARVLTELWGNPPDETLGLLMPMESTLLGEESTYVVEITYTEEGYIDDEDAENLDYDELLDEMKGDIAAYNPERVKMGYEEVSLIGWASKPFYDNSSNKLHWAKELQFGDNDYNTLNYNIRVLGRKGYLNLNMISDMEELPVVRNNMSTILASVDFNDGYRYNDFNPDMDQVAAYGIGGLIAGKILAKTGLLALLLKFWKVIALGAVGIFGTFRKKIFGSTSVKEG